MFFIRLMHLRCCWSLSATRKCTRRSHRKRGCRGPQSAPIPAFPCLETSSLSRHRTSPRTSPTLACATGSTSVWAPTIALPVRCAAVCTASLVWNWLFCGMYCVCLGADGNENSVNFLRFFILEANALRAQSVKFTLQFLYFLQIYPSPSSACGVIPALFSKAIRKLQRYAPRLHFLRLLYCD